MPFLLRSLLLQDWYSVTSRHRIILVSPPFSTSMSLMHLRIFSASQPRAVWCKTRAQNDVAAFHCLSCLRSSLLVIKYSGHPRKLSWSHLYSAAFALHVEHLHQVYLQKQVYCLFIFCSSVTSFKHATYTNYTECQKGSSSQYPTKIFVCHRL